jgi:hypothetical protein
VISGNSEVDLSGSGSCGSGIASISSLSVGSLCRLESGLDVRVSSELPELFRRRENLRCDFGFGEMGCRRNSGGTSLRQGLGRAIALASNLAVSIEMGILEIFRAIRSAF